MTVAPRLLHSYLAGRWQTGRGTPQELRDAATGEVVALIDATGLDLAEALAYGRRAGVALRAMSFHQRAEMLKALGQYLMERKDALHALSLHTGATPKDGWSDIDGGIYTFFGYASIGRRELPNTRVLVEGPAIALAKDDSFSARHILTPLQGVAVHINAFNFPVWGMLEKLAPTFLAGMPALVKPASQTAYLTEAAVRLMLESGLLPEGALQLVCGGVGDLFEHLTGQDVVTFTGSAETAQKLRAHPVILREAVRFNAEADSLNAAILGPDAGPGTPEFKLFVREVVQEMTAKAGQKCTAIRRVLVPRVHLFAVQEALAKALSEVAVGLPADAATKMGALASLAQREEVSARIRDLASEADIVVGDLERVTLVSGDPERGAFLNPVLLFCPDPHKARAPHEVEAFGPVATLMPYDEIEEAIALTHRGKGSLAASVFTDDPGVAEAMILGMAPFHGRILIGNRASAKSATGHGAPLPQLVHGGPGRAGGGEELGGIRSVTHYMQRTAVQGTPRLLTAVTHRYTPGAPIDTAVHPFRKSASALKPGDAVETSEREVTLADIEHFAHFTGDTFYAHMDDEAARANPFFDGRVAHGYLVLSFAAGLFVDPAPGPVLANYGLDKLRFLTPVYPGDRLKVRLVCAEINPREGAGHAEVRWDATVTNQKGAVVARYELLTMVAKDWPPAG